MSINTWVTVTDGILTARYLARCGHWEITKGMKVCMGVSLYKGDSIVYQWGVLPDQDLTDIKKYPYKESGCRGTIVGTVPCEYDRVEILTS